MLPRIVIKVNILVKTSAVNLIGFHSKLARLAIIIAFFPGIFLHGWVQSKHRRSDIVGLFKPSKNLVTSPWKDHQSH